ncbi:hypothetical protein KIPB_008159 [Kipferlia bialata]|uniref:Uncharacterized protein n=1 Tax=Kipferlia bialata TaxID=797122 RepID=A0A9K3D0B5_9EUKA|nr:hypothetical protein KIPB_008159 [Kipferlia bialata]|eukprot:g8159.t1
MLVLSVVLCVAVLFGSVCGSSDTDAFHYVLSALRPSRSVYLPVSGEWLVLADPVGDGAAACVTISMSAPMALREAVTDTVSQMYIASGNVTLELGSECTSARVSLINLETIPDSDAPTLSVVEAGEGFVVDDATHPAVACYVDGTVWVPQAVGAYHMCPTGDTTALIVLSHGEYALRPVSVVRVGHKETHQFVDPGTARGHESRAAVPMSSSLRTLSFSGGATLLTLSCDAHPLLDRVLVSVASGAVLGVVPCDATVHTYLTSDTSCQVTLEASSLLSSGTLVVGAVNQPSSVSPDTYPDALSFLDPALGLFQSPLLSWVPLVSGMEAHLSGVTHVAEDSDAPEFSLALYNPTSSRPLDSSAAEAVACTATVTEGGEVSVSFTLPNPLSDTSSGYRLGLSLNGETLYITPPLSVHTISWTNLISMAIALGLLVAGVCVLVVRVVRRRGQEAKTPDPPSPSPPSPGGWGWLARPVRWIATVIASNTFNIVETQTVTFVT